MSTKREYCGIGKVPKGAVRGSAKQCAELGQVRYWGEKKIDSRTLAAVKDPTITKESELKLKLQYAAFLGSKKQLEKYITTQEKRVEVGTATETDKQKLSESKTELEKVVKLMRAIIPKIQKLEAAKKKAILDITPEQAVKAIPLKDRKQIVEDAVSRKGTKKKTSEQVAAYQEGLKAQEKSESMPKLVRKPAGRVGTKKKYKYPSLEEMQKDKERLSEAFDNIPKRRNFKNDSQLIRFRKDEYEPKALPLINLLSEFSKKYKEYFDLKEDHVMYKNLNEKLKTVSLRSSKKSFMAYFQKMINREGTEKKTVKKETVKKVGAGRPGTKKRPSMISERGLKVKRPETKTIMTGRKPEVVVRKK